MLVTNLTHITSESEFHETLRKHENVMICCGRMGPMCLPVYEAMGGLQENYSHVAFRDMEFDSSFAGLIRNLPECRDFRGLPFTVYFRNGKGVKATTSIQTRDEIIAILDTVLAPVAAK